LALTHLAVQGAVLSRSVPVPVTHLLASLVPIPCTQCTLSSMS
jgi:hypothetical protein